jgi:hypothetical protein
MLDQTYGKGSPIKVKGQFFSDMMMKHVGQSNVYRRELPNLFNAETGNNRRKIVEERLSEIAKVPLPPTIKKLVDAEKRFGG